MAADVLALIDGALRDYEAGSDAMRWAPPEAQAEEKPAPAPVALSLAVDVSGMRRAFLAGRLRPLPGDGWHYLIRVSPEGRPDFETGPVGPMTRDEALARETPPDRLSGWRSVAVGVITAGG